MPLTITIPARDGYNEATGLFFTTKAQTVTLEHSLISVSKWEMKWHIPYFSREPKTNEQNLDYIRCMCLTPNIDPNTFFMLTEQNIRDIAAYIEDPMTATTIKRKDKRPSREIVTSELIYFWMTEFNIPFNPCEKWHLNRLMTLIEVASIKSQPGKKMSKKDILSQNAALNAQRRARFGTRG